MKDKWARWSIHFLLITLWLAAMAMLYMYIWLPLKPFQEPIIKQPFKVLTPVVARGDELYFEIDVEKFEDVPVSGSRNLICGDDRTTLTDIDVSLPLGRIVTRSLPTVIPSKTSLGECYMELKVQYFVSEHKIVTRYYKTEMFEVIE